jgi:hypothetical protein
MAGAPVGNQNAKKGRIWAEAIKRAVARKFNGDLNHGLDRLAEKLVDAVSNGDLPALKEFGDRMEGKPAQAIIGGEDDDPPVRIQRVERRIVRAQPGPSDS